MSKRGSPRFGGETMFLAPSPNLRMPALAEKWHAAGENAGFVVELQSIADLYERSTRQLALVPPRKDITATLAAIVPLLRSFRRDWLSPQSRALNILIRPMPCGGGTTYEAWQWFIESTMLVSQAAQRRGRDMQTSRFRRKMFLRLATSAQALSMAISIIDFTAEKEILYRRPLSLAGDSDSQRSLLAFTSLFLNATTKAHRDSAARTGPTVRHEARVAVYALADCYERFCRAHFTHTRYRGDTFPQAPQSRAGQFVMEFFGAVAPGVTGRSICRAMAQVVRERHITPMA